MSTAATIIITVISSGVFSTLITCVFKLIENNQAKNTYQDLVNQEVLLWLIKDRGKKALTDGSITNGELQDITRVYELYHKIGGNGFAEAIMNKVKALPLGEQ